MGTGWRHSRQQQHYLLHGGPRSRDRLSCTHHALGTHKQQHTVGFLVGGPPVVAGVRHPWHSLSGWTFAANSQWQLRAGTGWRCLCV
jgi:hypothetical protein